MPIKLPKGFPRRKSSGNALDEVEEVPTPSFRVLERPSHSSKSFDGGSKLGAGAGGSSFQSPVERVGRASFDQSRANSNRGSGGSNANSTSTGGFFDNASSSRLSSSSTVPSSIGTPGPDDSYSTKQHKPLPSIPAPPVPESQPAFSVKAGSRTFSFGARVPKLPSFGGPKQLKDLAGTRPDSSPSSGPLRNRAMTESSYASTATPPKLETDLVPSDVGGFAGIFDNIGRRRSELWEEGEPTISPAEHDLADPVDADERYLPLAPGRTPETYSNARQNITIPAPIYVDRSREVEPAVKSWGSHGSRDRLMMVSPSPPLPTSSSIEDGVPPPVPRHYAGGTSPESFRRNATLENVLDTPRARQGRPSSAVSGGLKRSSAIMDRRSTMPLLDDEDARLVMDSVNATRSSHRRSGESPKTPRAPAQTVKDRDGHRNDGPIQASISVTPSRESPSPRFGFSPEKTITSGSEQEKNPLIPPVHTDGLAISDVQTRRPGSPSEEHISSQIHRWSPGDVVPSGQGSTADRSDFPDSLEEDQTRKQKWEEIRTKEEIPRVDSPDPIKEAAEAQLSKRPVLGPTRSDIPIRSRVSTQNVPTSFSMENLQSEKDSPAQRNSDDEDEDIPLGILAAHGFPNKNRPPAKLSMAGSHATLQSLSQLNPQPPTTTGSVTGEPSARNSFPPPPGSVVGEPSIRTGRTSTLPVFARGLPQDPYQATGLVHPSNREPLGSGLNPAGLRNQGGIPPGGLVSVIAGEEKARAMRRGGPIAQGGYGLGVPSNPAFASFGPSLSPSFGPGPGPVLSASSPRHSYGAIPNMNMTGMGGPLMPGGLPPPMPPPMTAADQAQIQMSQQMTEMMRMQIQWMQQMMQFQGAQGGMPNMPQPIQQQPTVNLIPPPVHGSRPASVSGVSIHSNSGVLPIHQRTMTMLDPGMTFPNQIPNNSHPFQYIPSFRLQAPNQPYAASIAPSERSNVGLPSRYRPVSTGPSTTIERDMGAPRASTFTSASMLKDWDARKDNPPIVKTTEAKPTIGGKPSDDDDDDDEGWEEMKRKREKTKSKWRFKKESSSSTTTGTKDTHVSEK